MNPRKKDIGMANTARTVILADGENLFCRYQEMAEEGRIKKDKVIYHKDGLVWHPDITQVCSLDLLRASYYTTLVGSEDKLDEFRKQLAREIYAFKYSGGAWGSGTLCPRVFKKEKKKSKTKSVDINITIDALRHTYNNSVDIIFLLTGDGDYIPLIKEIMRQGKLVILGAFSSGLNPDLSHIVDDFFSLDDMFFYRQVSEQQPSEPVTKPTESP